MCLAAARGSDHVHPQIPFQERAGRRGAGELATRMISRFNCALFSLCFVSRAMRYARSAPAYAHAAGGIKLIHHAATQSHDPRSGRVRTTCYRGVRPSDALSPAAQQ